MIVCQVDLFVVCIFDYMSVRYVFVCPLYYSMIVILQVGRVLCWIRGGLY